MNNKILYNVSIEQLLQNKLGSGLGRDIIISPNLPDYIDLFTFPLRVDAIVFLVCLKGTARISINLKEWELSKDMYLISLPENTIGLKHISNDFEGYTFILSMDYIRSISLNLKEILPYYGYVRIHPCFQVAHASVKLILQYFNLLSVLLNEDDSIRKKDIVKGLINSLVNKLADDLDEFGVRSITVKTKSKEYYFMNFTELLLVHFREEHGVGFYAKKLGLTPKYLSAIMKDVSGMTAAEWINNYMVLEAQTLLSFTDMNIMQIADHLNFPNQSFFSKYFKQHVGQTPKQYRNSNNV
ncbi:MAG: AraC family transcriptional regulator [Bacteroidales bacterium]|nr:AraC family transcriptional regulator [Bacteroidales bacterium]